MRTIALACCLLTASLPLFAQGPDIYDEKVTSAGNIAATIPAKTSTAMAASPASSCPPRPTCLP